MSSVRRLAGSYEGPSYEAVRAIRRENLNPAMLTYYRCNAGDTLSFFPYLKSHHCQLFPSYPFLFFSCLTFLLVEQK